MTNTIEKTAACKICNNNEHNTHYIAKEMMYGFKDEFEYFQCSKCHCLQIIKFPEDLSKYYPTDYYSFSKYNGNKFKGLNGVLNKYKYTKLISGSKSSQKIASLFAGNNDYTILQDFNVSKETKILDVGCGNGKSFLYPLAEVGYKNTLGCDPYINETINYDNGLEIKNVSIYDIKGKWDIITYHHSYEHVPDPLEQMGKVYELLKPGGVCILRIPTVSSLVWEKYKTDWAQLDAPRHFFLHSTDSMKMIGEKSNLNLFRTIYDSTHFQFTGSEKYLNDIPLSTPRKKGLVTFIQRKLKKKQYISEAKKLNKNNRGDQAAFYFRKPTSN